MCGQFNGPTGTPNNKVNAVASSNHLNSQLICHLLARILNLEAMMEYGCDSWKIYNTVLTQMIQHAQKALQDVKYVTQPPQERSFRILKYVVFIKETNSRRQLGQKERADRCRGED